MSTVHGSEEPRKEYEKNGHFYRGNGFAGHENMPSEALTAALYYHDHGFFVVPCCTMTEQGACTFPHTHDTEKSIGKRPILGNEWQNARLTREEIIAWWTKHPTANVGVLLEPSGLLVIDLDSDEATEEATIHGLPPGPQVRAGRGVHHYFRNPKNIIGLAIGRGESRKIDILSKGIVVGFGSGHRSGKRYALLTSWEEWPLEDPPLWAETLLLERLKEQASTEAPPDDLPPIDLDELGLAPWLRAVIVHGQAPHGDPYPSRSEAVWAVLCALVDAGFETAIIASILLDPRFAISAKPREQGLRWVMGEIGRARVKTTSNGQHEGASAASATTEGTTADDWKKSLLKTEKGRTTACSATIALILRHTPDYADQLRFNTFTGQIETGPRVVDDYKRAGGSQQWTDRDDAELASFLLDKYKMPVTNLKHCAQAVAQVAGDKSYDPITTWLDSLPVWDGTKRLDSFFKDYCTVPASAKPFYTAFCANYLFVSLVARAYNPGCQSDCSIVLQGPEGIKKTSLLRLIGGPWYHGITLSFESKDMLIALSRTWLGELAELDSFARSGQNRIKAQLTMLEDSYRPPYGRHEIKQPRRAVFVGTTNDPVYLVGQHGGRRFYPLEVGDIAIDRIAPVLKQLFAEARRRYSVNPNWWQESDEVKAEAIAQREQVREVDPWEIKIEDWCTSHPGTVHMDDIMGSLCLDISTERQTRANATRIGVILHKMGYEKVRLWDKNKTGERPYAYRRKE